MPFGMKFFGHRMKDPVDGSLQIETVNGSHITGWVSAPNIGPVWVQLDGSSPQQPLQPAQTVPARVDRADPSRVEIAWDRMAGAEPPRSAVSARTTRTTTNLTLQPGQTGADLPPGVGDEVRSLVDKLIADAKASGATVTTSVNYEVLGAPGRAMPGQAGGGLTPEQAAAAQHGGAGMTQAQARVIAVHEVAVPPGMPGGGPAGTLDLTLDVSLPDGGGYATTMRIGFSTPEKRNRVAALGALLPVLVDPANHDRIAIDTTRMP